MNSKIRTVCLLVAVALLTSMATLTWAEGIKSRMLARLPKIQALKAEGVIGEDKNGFLQFRKAAADRQALINAENADRGEIYKAIAAQQGASAAVVGQRRALQIADRARPGEWLQKADGSWYQK